MRLICPRVNIFSPLLSRERRDDRESKKEALAQEKKNEE
jgi:hypothetical protein